MIDRVRLQAEAAPVQALAQAVETVAADSGESLDAQRANVGAAKTLKVAVSSWAGAQADEVLAGARPLDRWRAYGAELKARLEKFQGELRDSSGWFGRVLNWFGDQVQAGLDALERRVLALQAEVKSIGALRDAVNARSNLLFKHIAEDGWSAATIDALYGEAADAADLGYRQLLALADGLVEVVTTVRGGSANLEPTGTGELSYVPLHGEAGLGLVQIAAGAVLATVAVAAALAVSVRAYYAHADEVSRAEVAKLELDLVQQGKGAEVVQLQQTRTEADKAREGDGLSSLLATAGKTVAGVVGVGLVGYVGFKLLQRAFDKQARRWGP